MEGLNLLNGNGAVSGGGARRACGGGEPKVNGTRRRSHFLGRNLHRIASAMSTAPQAASGERQSPPLPSEGSPPSRMDAIVFRGRCSVAFERVPAPRLQEPGDAVVRVALAGLCGSDLHPYHCREEGLDEGTVMGHEFVGHVVAAGEQWGSCEGLAQLRVASGCSPASAVSRMCRAV